MESLGKPDRLKDEQADDTLGPRRAGLQRSRDDDVVGARNDIVPARGVEVVTLVDTRALRERSGHCPVGLLAPVAWRQGRKGRWRASSPINALRPLRNDGGLVDAPGGRVVGAKGQYPHCPVHLLSCGPGPARDTLL